MTVCQGQEKTLTFHTHIPSFTQLVVCIYQLFKSQAAIYIVSEKSSVFTFFLLEKPKLQNLTLS